MAAIENKSTPASREFGAHYWSLGFLRKADSPRPPNANTVGDSSGGGAKNPAQRMLTLAKEFGIDFTAGTAGAIVCVYAGQPLDTVKVKMQTFPEIHHTAFRCATHVLQKEGIRGLYAGTVPALAANIAENSILFAAYGLCQRAVAHIAHAKGPDDLSPLGNATAGFFAAFFSSLTLCPTELVKCRMQATRELNAMTGVVEVLPGPWAVTRQILATEGTAGLFCGFTSTLAREMPGYFCFFGGYEGARLLLEEEGGRRGDAGHFTTFLSGGVAGLSLWLVMYPTDVIKSRIQVQGSRIPMWRMAHTVFRTEGVAAFYNGLLPTIVRSFPATGLLLVTYEIVKKNMRDLFPG